VLRLGVPESGAVLASVVGMHTRAFGWSRVFPRPRRHQSGGMAPEFAAAGWSSAVGEEGDEQVCFDARGFFDGRWAQAQIALEGRKAFRRDTGCISNARAERDRRRSCSLRSSTGPRAGAPRAVFRLTDSGARPRHSPQPRPDPQRCDRLGPAPAPSFWSSVSRGCSAAEFAQAFPVGFEMTPAHAPFLADTRAALGEP